MGSPKNRQVPGLRMAPEVQEKQMPDDLPNQGYNALDKLDVSARVGDRIASMGDPIARVDTSLARIARLSNQLDPMFSAGLKLAEHQYLIDKRVAMAGRELSTGIDQATLSALQQMPSSMPAIPQLADWPQQFFDVSQHVRSLFSGVDRFIGNMGVHLASVASMAPASGGLIGAVQASSAIVPDLNAVMGNLPKIRDFNRFWDTIAPAMEGFREAMAEAKEGDMVLEEAQFGFADHLWNVFYLRGFAQVPYAVRDAVVTNMLAAQTRSDAFVDDLRQQVEASRMMRKRWRS